MDRPPGALLQMAGDPADQAVLRLPGADANAGGVAEHDQPQSLRIHRLGGLIGPVLRVVPGLPQHQQQPDDLGHYKHPDYNR